MNVKEDCQKIWHFWYYLREFITGVKGGVSPFRWLSTSVCRKVNLHCIFKNYLYLRCVTVSYSYITFNTSWWRFRIVIPLFLSLLLCSDLLDGKGTAASTYSPVVLLSLHPPCGLKDTLLIIYLLRCCWGHEPVLSLFLSIYLVNNVCLCSVCRCAVALAIPVLYYLKFLIFSYRFPKLREQGLVHLKSHVVLHGELTGYLLITKLRVIA